MMTYWSGEAPAPGESFRRALTAVMVPAAVGFSTAVYSDQSSDFWKRATLMLSMTKPKIPMAAI
jgi:hypothetical protein